MTTGNHAGHDGERPDDDPEEVDVHGLAEVLQRRPGDRRFRFDAGSRDEHIDLAFGHLHVGKHVLIRVRIAHVTHHRSARGGVRPQFAGELVQQFLATGYADDGRTSPCQLDGDPAAETGRRAVDHR